MPTPRDIIKHLNLEKHCEGGYFCQTYRSRDTVVSHNQDKQQLTSIYYLLTREFPISYFVRNQSDLIIYYHLGAPLKIIFLDTDGNVSERVLGPDIANGQTLQVICPANSCKAYELVEGEFSLIGEAVAPGFEYQDMYMPSLAELKKYESNFDSLEKYVAQSSLDGA